MEQEVLSLVSKLEPVLGISFALNLAYIGLPRFRYREKIRDHVRQKMDEMQDIPEQTCATDWYKQIFRLGQLENNDGDAGENKQSVKLPSEIWSKLYGFLYERHLDRAIVFMAALSCAILLFAGVAHELSYLDFSRPAFTRTYIHWWFWATAFAACLPVGLVFMGGYVVNGAVTFVNNNTRNLKITFQRDAQAAVLDAPVTRAKPRAKSSNAG